MIQQTAAECMLRVEVSLCDTRVQRVFRG